METHIPGGVYLRQVSDTVSCGACCGLSEPLTTFPSEPDFRSDSITIRGFNPSTPGFFQRDSM